MGLFKWLKKKKRQIKELFDEDTIEAIVKMLTEAYKDASPEERKTVADVMTMLILSQKENDIKAGIEFKLRF